MAKRAEISIVPIWTIKKKNISKIEVIPQKEQFMYLFLVYH